MITTNNMVWSLPSRQISAVVELYNSSTFTGIYDSSTKGSPIKKIVIDRIGEEGKLFGFGISHKLTLNLQDKDRQIDITNNNSFRCYFSAGFDHINSYPLLTTQETKRDENTNELTIVAYDALYKSTEHTFSELGINPPYTIADIINGITALLGLIKFDYIGFPQDYYNVFEEIYSKGANFDGTETLRDVLNRVAEYTQSIYYIDKFDSLIFKRLDRDNEPLLAVGKASYFTLQSKPVNTLSAICSATELGDNVISPSVGNGITQYIKDNPFYAVREDMDEILEAAIEDVGGLTIAPFECTWRGNPALEPGDKISIVTKDNGSITTYILNESLSFAGGLKCTNSWTSIQSDTEGNNNPTSLGETLKKTFAKVDKVNKEIELVADETAKIKLDAESIVATVSAMDENMSKLTAEVNTKVSAEDVEITIKKALDTDIERVTTSTGFTFNEEGLHISKTNSEIKTSITENGMKVYKNDSEVLTADNQGVKAEDLHATTFLIIGNNSRLEDYNSSRTGCFWIGR